MKVSVRELKTHLSEYLHDLAHGGEIIVTSRGKPVARLLPAASESSSPEELSVARLRSQPWVRPGRGGVIHGTATPMHAMAGEKSLSEILLEDRD